MTSAKIKKNIPVSSQRGRKLSYDFDAMKVGDSFDEPFTQKKYNSIRTAAYLYGNRHGKKFQGSKLTEKGKKIIRIWRTK